MHRVSSVTALFGVLLLAACDNSPMDVVTTRITILAGDNQTGPAGSVLPVPLAVRVMGSDNRPVVGAVVHWEVGESGGAVSTAASPSITDDIGVAHVARALGDHAGVHVTTAWLDGRSSEPVRFTSIAHVQGATTMVPHPAEHGAGQADTVLATLAPYRVLILDHDDEPVEGVVVSWLAIDGSVSSATSTSDASGVALVQHTLGTDASTEQVVQAYVQGLGSPVRSSATAHPGNPTQVVAVAGDEQLGAAEFEAEVYVVHVTDAHGNAINGIAIDWAVTSGGGSLVEQHNLTDPSATATHRLGPFEGPQTVTATAPSVPGAPYATFTTTAVTARVWLLPYDSYYCWYYGTNCTPEFSPKGVIVPAGSTVGWLWSPGIGACNVVFEDDPEPPMSAPTKATGRHLRTFNQPGTYRYRCTTFSASFTEGMVGTVEVQ